VSDHSIPIIRIGEMTPHPNADRLVLTKVGGWQVVVGRDEFEPGDPAIYIPPDFTVDVSRPAFAFLANRTSKPRMRIKVAQLRGEISQGLMIPIPEELDARFGVGDDVSAALDIERYEPPESATSGADRAIAGPSLLTHKFDIETYQRYADVFLPGERLVVTEKIHGANVRVVMNDGVLFVGSRTEWWEEHSNSVYWRAVRSEGAALLGLLADTPNVTFYGEAFGQVQKLKYGAKSGEVWLALFAAMRADGTWIDTPALRETCAARGVRFVPFLGVVENDEAGIRTAMRLAEEDSAIEDHLREGVVLVPEIERRTPTGERVALKLVSNRYLMKS